MSNVEQLHNDAMDLAEEAFRSQRKGDTERTTKLFRQALEFEKQAFANFPATKSSEPTRSILVRSAASIALHAKDYEQAERLVSIGLTGFPPAEIKAELRALQEDINFKQHILLQGVEITDNEMQMTLWGNATGHGVISADLLIKKVGQIKTILYRTVERLHDLPYRTAGSPPKRVIDSFNLYLSGFVAGSFGVSFSIGEKAEQLPLSSEYVPKKVEIETVINEVLTCFQLLQKDEIESLKERFSNEDYLENFIGITRQMAPDGEAIKGVGLATISNGKRREIDMRRNRKDIPTPSKMLGMSEGDGEGNRKQFKLEGIIKLADSLKIEGKYGIIRLRNEEEDNNYSVRVPLTQMQDIVQPYFEEHVIISVYKTGKKYYFEDIDTTEVSRK
ncbi:hypothetical protein QUF64_14345 [Anaerolineales bacterium HSG6]|nr:hypothetical protein [Anaerolineales bacterium HSG6]